MLNYDVKKLKEIKEAIRHPYAWPGGYQLLLVMSDGEYMCLKCARKEWRNILDSYVTHQRRDGWYPVCLDIYWEGPTLQCCHCNADIRSEYGDPWAEEEDEECNP